MNITWVPKALFAYKWAQSAEVMIFLYNKTENMNGEFDEICCLKAVPPGSRK